jgi:hypothetical protein
MECGVPPQRKRLVASIVALCLLLGLMLLLTDSALYSRSVHVSRTQAKLSEGKVKGARSFIGIHNSTLPQQRFETLERHHAKLKYVYVGVCGSILVVCL